MLLQEKIAESDGVNWEGLAAIIIFYLAVLMVSITFIILQFVINALYFLNVPKILFVSIILFCHKHSKKNRWDSGQDGRRGRRRQIQSR